MADIGIQDRTKEAFQSMAVGELPALYSLARRLVRDGAEDLVQETLIRAYRSFGALKEDEAGARWLKSILLRRSRTSRCTRPWWRWIPFRTRTPCTWTS